MDIMQTINTDMLLPCARNGKANKYEKNAKLTSTNP